MKTQADYFDDFLNVSPFALALWRSGEAWTLDKIMRKWPGPVLDLGCGFGEFMGVFYDGIIEIGLDINHKDLIQAARSKKYRECRLADARKLPFDDESVQTIVSNSVLEHIPDVKKVFSEARRVLKPGGRLVFTVPTVLINSRLRIPQRLRRFGFSKLGKRYIATFHRVFKHINVWPEQKWLETVKKSGFRIITTKPTLTLRQLHLFESWLPTAFPSQMTRNKSGKRWVVDHPIRHAAWMRVAADALDKTPEEMLNMAVVGQKI